MLAERLDAQELMDDLLLCANVYEDVLADLARVNRLTFAYRPTLAFLRHIAKGRRTLRILDVGYGQGDMLRRIHAWARSAKVAVELVGIDLNPRSAKAARSAGAALEPIEFCTGDYADLAGHGWDAVISSLVAHHMSDDELLAFLRFMEEEASAGWFINDLHRHPIAYLGYPVLARLARLHPIVRRDGQTSVARSFRQRDWDDLLHRANVRGAEVRRYFPFRLCVEKVRA